VQRAPARPPACWRIGVSGGVGATCCADSFRSVDWRLPLLPAALVVCTPTGAFVGRLDRLCRTRVTANTKPGSEPSSESLPRLPARSGW
jgi:hypothetical protein